MGPFGPRNLILLKDPPNGFTIWTRGSVMFWTKSLLPDPFLDQRMVYLYILYTCLVLLCNSTKHIGK